MNILINCSNLKAGGGLQVADSICRELNRFKQHHFVVILSSFFRETASAIAEYNNVEVKQYNVKNSVQTVVFGRDAFLDNEVKVRSIDVVLTVFGPSRWEPRCPHLCGFAKAFHVIPESPYYSRMGRFELLKNRMSNKIYEVFFQRKTKNFFTENPFITSRLQHLFKNANVYTITNYYNQVFDCPETWKRIELPQFDGVTLLTISNSYPHKNLEIAVDVARILKSCHSDFKFRFVMSITREQMKTEINDVESNFLFLGTVDISECPSLYSQCDIAFQPTLIECFTAMYPEAMRMKKPIVTVDLEFAKGLCGEAACYYSAVDPASAAEAIYRVATDKEYSKSLVEKGETQLGKYDNYGQRADKLLTLLELIAEKK
uniref:glycosyltransferase n=1 Tax=Candidatus Cryptobacteroides bacterium TaxID=3085639 RepID=UPI0040265139